MKPARDLGLPFPAKTRSLSGRSSASHRSWMEIFPCCSNRSGNRSFSSTKLSGISMSGEATQTPRETEYAGKMHYFVGNLQRRHHKSVKRSKEETKSQEEAREMAVDQGRRRGVA